MKKTPITRREFIQQSALMSTGLLIGCSGNKLSYFVSKIDPQDQGQFNAWLHIGVDNFITYQVPSAEMGQGAQTGLTMIVAEELDADWTMMKTQFAPLNNDFANPKMKFQITGGSGSIEGFWEPMRKLGATARQMLIQTAAKKWNVNMSECKTDAGFVIHNSGKKFSYGELASIASKLEPPKEVKLKSPKDFKIIGKPMKRIDTPLKIKGEAEYGIDVQIPNLHIATLILSPTIGADVKSVDDKKALEIKGVKKVIRIPKNVADDQQAAGVAVVADSYYTALKAAKLLNIQWTQSEHNRLSTKSMTKDMKEALDDLKKPNLEEYEKNLSLEFQVPLLSHSPLEPMNATAVFENGKCKVWAPCQCQTVAGNYIKKVSDLDEEDIELNTTYLGGGFGRRLEADYVAYAVFVAKRSRLPVKLIWSREEDMKHDFYRPASMARFHIGLGEDGYPKLWHAQLTTTSYVGRYAGAMIPMAKYLPLDFVMGKTSSSMGMSQSKMDKTPFPYPIEDLNLDVKLVDTPVPLGSHRAVAHSYVGFFVESAIDEAAAYAGIDPYQYRRNLLKDNKRYIAVLDKVAKEANWGNPPEGRFHGIATFFANNSYVAQVAEISVSASKKVKVHKIVGAIDCGIAVNPDSVKAQFEGGVFWALCGTFTEEITISSGQIEQNNFYDYKTLLTKKMPEVEVHIIPSDKPPKGVGEPPVPPLPPAITNAIFAATGTRIRRLPISHDGFSI